MTSIVAVRTDTEIVIGADSKMATMSGIPSLERVCKIQQDGNLFFAYSGLISDTSIGFSVTEAIRQALGTHVKDSVSLRSVNFIGPFVSRLIDWLNYAIATNPSLFHEHIEGKPLVSIIMAGFDGEIPLLFRAHFIAAVRAPYGDAGVTVYTNSYSDNRGYSMLPPLVLGNIDAIRNILNFPGNFWQMLGAENGVRRLIELEVDGEPATVGPPIDILSITRDGARWVERKKECPDIVT